MSAPSWLHAKVCVAFSAASDPSSCPLIVQILHLLTSFWMTQSSIPFGFRRKSLVELYTCAQYLFSFSCHSAPGGSLVWYHAMAHQQLARRPRNQDANAGPSKVSFHHCCVCVPRCLSFVNCDDACIVVLIQHFCVCVCVSSSAHPGIQHLLVFQQSSSCRTSLSSKHVVKQTKY